MWQRSGLHCGKWAAIQNYSVGESTKALTLFRNGAGMHLLQDLFGYDLKRKKGSNVKDTNSSFVLARCVGSHCDTLFGGK